MAVNGNQTEAKNSTEHSSIGTYVPNMPKIDGTDALPLKRASAFKIWRPKAGEETSGPSNSGSGSKRPLEFDLNEMPTDEQHEGPSVSGSGSGEMPLEIDQLDIVSESNAAAQRLDNAALMNQGAEDEACVRGTESSHVNSQGAFTGEVPLFYERRQREGEMRLGICNKTTSRLVQKPTTSPKVHRNQTQFFSGSSSNPCRAPKSLFRNQGVAASSSIGNGNHPGFHARNSQSAFSKRQANPPGFHARNSQSAFSKRQAIPPRNNNTGDMTKRRIMYEGMSAVEYLNLFIATHPDIIPSMAHMYQKDRPTMMEPPMSFFSRIINNGNPAPAAVPENEVCSLNQNPADIEIPDDLMDPPETDAKRKRV